MCQTSRLHVGWYMVQNLGESIANRVRYDILNIKCVSNNSLYDYEMCIDYYY